MRLPRVERRIEITFEIRHGDDGILGRGPAAPHGVAVAPVGEGDVAGRRRHGLVHGAQQDAVGVEGHGAGRPVEAIFVEAIVGREGQLFDVKGARVGGVEAVLERLGRLEDEVDGGGGVVVLRREEFHVDFLGVVEVLRSHGGR